MSEKLLAQDVEVLDKLAKEKGWKNWTEMILTVFCENDELHVERVAVLARQAETARCLKEIDKLVVECEKDLHGKNLHDKLHARVWLAAFAEVKL